ncbi:MAG: hypothetical protein M3451_07435 [Chloroflexota bacterium]|nr:hypothetical protein [Chloroflexota bacterium]
MRSRLLLSLAILLAVPGSLSTQERLPEPLAPRSTAKSASQARLLSLAHTAVASSAGLALMSRGTQSDLYGVPGYWLFAYGTLAAPSVGNLYARDYARMRTGLAIRSAGAALVLTSAGRQLLSPAFDIDNPAGGKFRWDALNLTGAGVMAAGAAYSIATAPASVEQYNRRSTAPATPRVSLTPAYTPATGNVGVHVGVRF